MVNEVNGNRAKKLFQTVSYAPHFISTVVMCGMIILFLKPTSGLVNNAWPRWRETHLLYAGAENFKWIYVLSEYGRTQVGTRSSILRRCPPSTSRKWRPHSGWRQPPANHSPRQPAGSVPTIMIMLVLKFGQVMNIGYEKVFLLQNDANLPAQRSFPLMCTRWAGVQRVFVFHCHRLLNSIVNACMLLGSQHLSKRMTKSSLW
jgi:putative aldouronate transport system permease protein